MSMRNFFQLMGKGYEELRQNFIKAPIYDRIPGSKLVS